MQTFLCAFALVVDSWGNFPSALGNKNDCDPGSFTECFNIERNGMQYETQYCLGQLSGYYVVINLINSF